MQYIYHKYVRHVYCILYIVYVPRSSESHVDVSVPVTFVANVDADSVDVLIVVSAVDAIDDPITITFTSLCGCLFVCEINEKIK